ncbi:hypothetical protein BAA08_10810 [Bizionia sp. APA-3]|nr:hypothetical protein BAA08_10810 [Bizionia sp. APA-3]
MKKAELQIALKEEQWRTTFNHSKTGMALIDLTGQVQMTNQSLCDVLGYTEAEMKTMTIIDITFPEDLNDTFKFMEGVISGKQEGYNFEKRYITKKGNVIWANASVAAVKNDKNEFTHVVAQIVDITENKLLNESILEHNNRLINFAHIVSHNLRSHTGNMTMLLEISRTNNPDLLDEEIFQHLKTSSENMNDCVNYLSEIVEINTKVKDTLLSLNLKDYVNKALQNVQISVNEINCEIEINVADDLNVIAIPAYLDSIILNLITNALKYHSPKRSPKIIITSNQSEKYITLDITDNGQGIDLKKHGDKLFGMYKTFHDHKDARGIGLFISKNQIEAIGGKIEVKSEVNQGTTFKIYFKHEHSN